jgi:hypothetical protein
MIKTYNNTLDLHLELASILILLEKVYKEDTEELLYRFFRLIRRGNYLVDILKDDSDNTLGMCIYKYDYNMHTGDILRIDTLVVKEQGLGHGSELLKKFTDDTIQLECHVDNLEGQKFYEARNFIRRAYSYVR